jgi:modified peptide precursor CbpA
LGVIVTQNDKEKKMKKKTPLTIIAVRKSCKADGTGLSHFILMDKQVKK